MSWTRFLMHDFFTAQELNQVDQRFKRARKTDNRRRRALVGLEARVEELEDNLGRLSLLSCALLELGLAREAFSKEEILECLSALDERDGKADGKLDPKWMEGMGSEDESE